MKKTVINKAPNKLDNSGVKVRYQFSKNEESKINSLMEATNRSASALTIERLRNFPGCDHYTDKEADQIINSLQQIASICYDLFKAEKLCFDYTRRFL